MSKKITITLSDESEDYLNELLYSLTGENDKPATIGQCINESLETLSMFESATTNQLRNWLDDFNQMSRHQFRDFAADPTMKNMDKCMKKTKPRK